MQLNWGSLNEICLQDSKFSGEKQKAIGRESLNEINLQAVKSVERGMLKVERSKAYYIDLNR
jgi:hypothetical protein